MGACAENEIGRAGRGARARGQRSVLLTPRPVLSKLLSCSNTRGYRDSVHISGATHMEAGDRIRAHIYATDTSTIATVVAGAGARISAVWTPLSEGSAYLRGQLNNQVRRGRGQRFVVAQAGSGVQLHATLSVHSARLVLSYFAARFVPHVLCRHGAPANPRPAALPQSF